MNIKVESVVEALEMASEFATGYYDTVEGTVRWLHECSDFDDGLSELLEGVVN